MHLIGNCYIRNLFIEKIRNSNKIVFGEEFMGRLGIAVAVIVWLFYMSMIYGSAAMALAGFALIFL